MNKKQDDEEQRLYLWVRVIGASMLLVTLVLFVVAVLLLPLVREDYHTDTGTVVGLAGTLAASALALVEVQLRLRRNGNGDSK